jgi:hypothetical protein
MSVHKHGQQVGNNPCPCIKRDDKWESTHVHQTQFHQEYAAVKQQAKDGTRLIKPIGAGFTQPQKGVATT